MKTKRFFACLLAAVLAGSALVGCGESAVESETVGTDTGSVVPETAVAAETTRDQLEDGLPEKDYEGRTFHILTRQDYDDDFISEEQTGEILNDAIYNRNAAVMERFNIAIDYTAPECAWGTQADTWNTNLATSVMAGDGAYDLVAAYAASITKILSQKLFLNWHEIPHIDVTKPWWSEKVSDALTINGNQFFLTGDYSLALWYNMFAFLFNKQVADDYGIENLYDVVREGRWTVDKLEELATIATNDANGDGVWDDTDHYGILSNNTTSVDTFQLSCGIDILSSTADGGMEITVVNEKTLGLADTLYNMYNTSHIAYALNDNNGNSAESVAMFVNNQTLFFAIFLDATNVMRDMEADFGVLPYPKYDEAQTEYANTSRDNFDLFVIPLDVKDTEFSGIITEAMCAESYRSVVPAYYDVVLKSKNSRDADSAEMIDLIRDTLTFDVGYLCSNAMDGIGHMFLRSILGSQTNVGIVTEFAGIENSANAKLKELLAAYGYSK